MKTSIVQVPNFIMATRDSGYKNTASALAEMVDNSIESRATEIRIEINKMEDGSYEILTIDNGCGMTSEELNLALQFGGSSRFNSRRSLGRYGMGLPNSSISQCRRVEVYTWQKKNHILFNYLDVDEVVSSKSTKLPNPKSVQKPSFQTLTKSGTIVHWKKCDRLSFKYLTSIQKHLHFELGRIFRYSLWRGVKIWICDVELDPFDPLFLGRGNNLIGGRRFGKELKYRIKVPGTRNETSEVRARFVELPVELWSKFSNEEKRRHQITKCSGVSILRAEREIDYGWFFMGDKRKENYDDWWRCEISFQPELDEVFGVTHTKQEVKETEFLSSILIPDIEQAARTLNNRVRLKFIGLKIGTPNVYSKSQLERNDVYLSPVKTTNAKSSLANSFHGIRGFDYNIITRQLEDDSFYRVEGKNHTMTLVLNSNHVFYDKIFNALHTANEIKKKDFLAMLEVLLFSVARAEMDLSHKRNMKFISNFKRIISANITAFLS